MNYITIDIETIGTDRADVRDYLAASIKPPGTLKKAESIAKWEAEEKQGAIDEAVQRTGLDGAFGEIAVFGYAIGDSEAKTLTQSFTEGGERDLLLSINEALDKNIPAKEWLSTTVVGHNVSSFDLRFLVQRYIVNGVAPHPIIKRSAEAKPWESDKVYDTMIQWAGVGGRVSLEKLCLALGIKSPKGDIDGSKVWEAIKAGRIDDVAAYCVGDVNATRDVFRRMTFN